MRTENGRAAAASNSSRHACGMGARSMQVFWIIRCRPVGVMAVGPRKVVLARVRGMSRPLLEFGGGSGEILRDLLHLHSFSEAKALISAADGLPTATTGTHLIVLLKPGGGGIFDDRRWGNLNDR